MKKISALLCVILLLTACFASAEGGSVVEISGAFRLDGILPEGYSFSEASRNETTLDGRIASDNPAAPVLQVYIAFNDNESYAKAKGLKDLSEEELALVKLSFSGEGSVSFESFETASGDNLLVIRDADGEFLDFYTVCFGYEIELTLFPAEGRALAEAEISRCLELMKSLDIVPAR